MKSRAVSMIWAMDKNRGIGKDNKLPWNRLSTDMNLFKTHTKGMSVVMGRKTAESLPFPLPNRRNIVLTRNVAAAKESLGDKFIIFDSIEDIFEYQSSSHSNPEEMFIIGGAEIYKLFLPYANKLYLTSIDDTFDCDTHFPEINMDEWTLEHETKVPQSDTDDHSFTFNILSREDIVYS